MGNEQGKEEDRRVRENIASMSWSVKQNLLKQGVHYNMKVIIKGERNTGKTSLWRRLQGQSFSEAYTPTPEIQVCNITWNYKATDDTVKVEIWDVVDKGRPKKKTDGLKVSTDEDTDEEPQQQLPPALPGPKGATGSFTMLLDATTVDIYQGTNAVILMFDPTKKWTWDYVQKEIEKIPKDMFVLLLANYRDMNAHRAITEEFAREWVSLIENKNVRYMESSMLNGYGVKGIVTFFNIPFLKMQRAYLEQQLKQNENELNSFEQLIADIAKDETYENYIKGLEEARRNKNKGTSKQVTPPLTPTSLPSSSIVPPSQAPTTSSAPQPVPKPKEDNPPEPKPSPRGSSPSILTSSKQQTQPPKQLTQSPPKQQTPPVAKQPTQAPVAAPPPVAEAPSAGKKSGFFSKMVSLVSKSDEKPAPPKDNNAEVVENLKQLAATGTKGASTEDVDEFAPAGDLDDGFFKDEAPQSSKKVTDDLDDDDDDDRPNPLLMQDEDLDGPEREDVPIVTKPPPKPKPEPTKAPPPQPIPTSSLPAFEPIGEEDEEEELEPVQSNITTTSQVSKSPPVSRNQNSGLVLETRGAAPQKSTSPPAVKKATATSPKTAPKKSPRGKQNSRKQYEDFEESSDDDAPNSLVMQTEDDSDDDFGGGGSPLVMKVEDDSDEDEPPAPVKKKAPAKKAAPSKPKVEPIPDDDDDWDFTQPAPEMVLIPPSQQPKKSAAPVQKDGQKRRKPRPVNETPEEREARKRRHREKRAAAQRGEAVPQRKPGGPVY